MKWSFSPGKLETAARAAIEKLRAERFPARLWERDASLWKSEPDIQRQIRNALGWLTVGRGTTAGLRTLLEFVGRARKQEFKYAVLLGMGGSSLCPDVCAATFGTVPGFLELQVLDSTVPASVIAAEKSVQLEKTLFIVSSKSGGTIETLSFYKYFYDRVRSIQGDAAGDHFLAITDPRTPLEHLAREKKFRAIFPGAADVGGRFSALSVFGIVPAALAGVDVKALLERGEAMARACGPEVAVDESPGATLGAILGAAALNGRDKLTFVMSPGIYTFADWAEQLIAESTGKEGKVIVPVVREHLRGPEAYGDDRIFVHMSLAGEVDESVVQKLEALSGAGHPVVRITLEDRLDLGGEFFRWEVATAAAGALLGINPFDQPNVAESKDNTSRLLAEFKSSGRLPEDSPLAGVPGLKVYSDGETAQRLAGSRKDLVELLSAYLSMARRDDYVALLAYIHAASSHKALLKTIHMRLADGLKVASTAGYGPRYLHSTGQLHKGDAGRGLFLLITADDSEDVPIPGEPYTFSVLKLAQALGDFQSLAAKKRRVLRVHLGKNVQAGLDRLLGALEQVLENRRARKTVTES